MKQRKIFAISVLTIALSVSCGDKTVTTSSSRDHPANTSLEEGHQTTAGYQPTHIAPNTVGAYALHKNCDGVEIRIRCDTKYPACKRTILSAKSDRLLVTIEPPTELAHYTAVGIGCAAANNGTPYIVVQYGELPYSCKHCEWFHLYDDSLNLLTRSHPPVLHDDSLPESWRNYANNDEFKSLTERLGINETNLEIFNHRQATAENTATETPIWNDE